MKYLFLGVLGLAVGVLAYDYVDVTEMTETGQLETKFNAATQLQEVPIEEVVEVKKPKGDFQYKRPKIAIAEETKATAITSPPESTNYISAAERRAKYLSDKFSLDSESVTEILDAEVELYTGVYVMLKDSKTARRGKMALAYSKMTPHFKKYKSVLVKHLSERQTSAYFSYLKYDAGAGFTERGVTFDPTFLLLAIDSKRSLKTQ